jgi:hypothetical protein
VQGEIRDLLRNGGGFEGHAYRIEIRIAVDRGGVIRDAAVRRQSGAPGWDRHVVSVLQGRTLASPPPSDLSEALAFEVVSNPLSAPAPPRGIGR